MILSPLSIVGTVTHSQFIEETLHSPDILGFELMTHIRHTLRSLLDEISNITDNRRLPFLVWEPPITKLRYAPQAG